MYRTLRISIKMWPCLPKECHPSDHVYIILSKPFPHKCETTCGHQCTKRCHFPRDFPPCQFPMSKILPGCGHCIIIRFSTIVENTLCNEPCPRILINFIVGIHVNKNVENLLDLVKKILSNIFHVNIKQYFHAEKTLINFIVISHVVKS